MDKQLDYFDSIAADFEHRMNPFDLSSRLAWCAEQLARLALKGEMVLDVGCGLGHFSRLVRDRGGHPVPLDIGHHLLLKVRNHLPACVEANALSLPFPDSSFTVVISSECVEHTPDPLLAIQEMVRVLRPEGTILLTTPNRVWHWSVALAERLGIRSFAGIENWVGRHQVRRTLTNHGARVLVEAGLFLIPFQLRVFWPLNAWINRHAQVLRSLMINQCWLARKLQKAQYLGRPSLG